MTASAHQREMWRKTAARYKKLHPEKVKACNAKYRQENREKRQAGDKKYKDANKETIVAKAKQYKELNRERIKSSRAEYVKNHPEIVKASRAKYEAAHPELRAVYNHNRRAKISKNGGALSKGISKKLYELQKGKCACCGKPLGNRYHLDHVMPLALGGRNEDRNMQLLRQRCNNQKHAKHPVDFMQSRGFLL